MAFEKRKRKVGTETSKLEANYKLSGGYCLRTKITKTNI